MENIIKFWIKKSWAEAGIGNLNPINVDETNRKITLKYLFLTSGVVKDCAA